MAMGPLSGQTLIDSGASRHSLGRLGMKYAQNVRRIDPLIMNTANGQVTLSLVGDVVLKDGTLVRDWLINKWSETNLLSEGLANADKSTNSLMITSSDPSLPKMITTATTKISAMRIGVLDFLPPELDIGSELFLANCTSEVSSVKDQTNVTSGVTIWTSASEVLDNCHPKKIPVTFPVFPEFLDILDANMGSEPNSVRGSDLLDQYSDIICCYRLEDESIAQHEKAGHYPSDARLLCLRDSLCTKIRCSQGWSVQEISV